MSSLKQIITSCINLVSLYNPNANVDIQDKLAFYLLEEQNGVTIFFQYHFQNSIEDLKFRVRLLNTIDWYVDIGDDTNVFAYKILRQEEIMDFVKDNLQKYDYITEIKLKCYNTENYRKVWTKDKELLQKLEIHKNLQKINDELNV